MKVLSKLQLWTTPLWLILMVLPFAYLLLSHPDSVATFFAYQGENGNGAPNLGSVFLAAGVCLSLIAQIAEQIDYLRFMPPKTPENARQWWSAMLLAGPGWVIFGAIKQVIGLFLAVYLIANVAGGAAFANQPVQQFLEIYQGFMPHWAALALAVCLVVISQVKINVTNAYSGSLAWTNSFTRITKHYPGRLVFLGVNLLIALVLMEANMFDFLNTILGFYANCGMAWVVAVASDIAINKYLLKISPKRPEFRRGMLYAVNPVGFGSMLIAAGVSIAAFFGALGSGSARTRRSWPSGWPWSSRRSSRSRPKAGTTCGAVTTASTCRWTTSSATPRASTSPATSATTTTSDPTWSRASPTRRTSARCASAPTSTPSTSCPPTRLSSGPDEGVSTPLQSGEKPAFREVTEVAYRGGMTGLRPRLPWM